MATSESEGEVICCHTAESWTEQLAKANGNHKLVVVYFTAAWCAPCRLIAPVLAELAKKSPNVMFLKVDVDELKSVASDWAVEVMPTFFFLKLGKILDKIVGASKEELLNKVDKHLKT